MPDGAERRLLSRRLSRGLQEAHREARAQPARDRRPEQRDCAQLVDSQVRHHLPGRGGPTQAPAAHDGQRRLRAHPQQGPALRDVPVDPRHQEV